MRAGFGALADKYLPSLIADAEDEVAAAFKGIFKILMGNCAGLAEKLGGGRYQSTLKSDWRGFGKGKARLELHLLWLPSRCGRDAPTTAAGTAALHLWRAAPIASRRLVQEVFQVLPVDQDYVIVLQRLFE